MRRRPNARRRAGEARARASSRANAAARCGYCSGTLVADDLVLTARHCTRSPFGAPFEARFGARGALICCCFFIFASYDIFINSSRWGLGGWEPTQGNVSPPTRVVRNKPVTLPYYWIILSETRTLVYESRGLDLLDFSNPCSR